MHYCMLSCLLYYIRMDISIAMDINIARVVGSSGSS